MLFSSDTTYDSFIMYVDWICMLDLHENENDTITYYEHAKMQRLHARTHTYTRTYTNMPLTTQRPTLNNNYLPIEPRYTLPQYIHSHPNAVTAHHPTQWLNR